MGEIREKCPHAPYKMVRVCNICDAETVYVNVLRMLEWIDAQLRANPQLNDHFRGYREALLEVKAKLEDLLNE